MIDKGRNSYDEIPYPSVPKADTHPEHLATLGTLLGMSPARVDHCRVLELGCADGGNLIPLAYAFPESEFVGIDLSARQIASGRAALEELGLRNVTLRHLDILDVGPDFGRFDYIICYGVYSWVPPAVQEKILEVCKRNLAPHGIAYVSYNTYPGWHVRGMVRDMMLYHTRGLADLRAGAREIRRLLGFLVDSTRALTGHRVSDADATGYALALQREQELLSERAEWYLIHEFLEEFNEPVYFHQFAERAARHGLQYLGEAEYSTMDLSNFPAPIADTLRALGGDLIEVEQYMDFVRNRTFRQTLLCHEGIPLDRQPAPESLSRFYVGSPALPVSAEPDLHSATPEKFRGPSGTVLSVSTPLAKAAMLYLTRIWPQVIPVPALLARARAMLDPQSLPVQGAASVARELRSLGEMLLRCYSLNLVEFHVQPLPFVTEIGEFPVASPVARFQARSGTVVTNLRHEEVTLDDEVSYHLLRHLDGRRDRAALLAMLLDLVAEGTLVVQPDGERLAEPQQVAGLLAETLDRSLHRLANAALLVG